MCQGLRVLVATLAAVLLLPGVRAGEPQPTIQCKICVVRVNDDCYNMMRAHSAGCAKCCQACPSCPTCSHTPCEQKTANASCCDQACRQKCGSEECCENCPAVPATMPCLLNTCTVQHLLEVAKGQAGCQIECCPRVMCDAGQTACVRTGCDQFFVTNVERTSVHGCETFVPRNECFSMGLDLKVQPSFTPDGKAIVLNVEAQSKELDTTETPVHPVTTFITPIYEGGAQGQPTPFTQFIQQPSFTIRGMHKVAACPTGKTLVLDCGRRTSTARVISAVPVLSELPLIGEFFRDSRPEKVSDHLLVFVTPTASNLEAGEESSVETTTEVALPLFAMPVMCEEGRVTPVSNVEYLPNAPRPITPPITPPVPCQACPAQGCPTVCPCPSTAALTAMGVADCMVPHPTIVAVPCTPPCQACPTQCCPGACPSMTPPPPVAGGGGFVFAQWPTVLPYNGPVFGCVPPCPTRCAEATCPCPSCPTQCGQGANCPCPTQASCARSANASQVQLDMKLVFVSDEFFDRDGAGVWTQFAPKAGRGNSIFVCGEEIGRFIADAQAKGFARVVAEPRLVTLSGRPATFHSGGQLASKNSDGEMCFEPLGILASFNPTVSPDGRFVRIGMDLVQSDACQEQCSCPHAAQHVNSHASSVTASLPWGQTFVRCVRSECAPGKSGEYLYVVATPTPVDPAPAYQAVQVCPPPCVATFTASAPMPCVQPVAATVPTVCPDLQLVHLMIEYHEASRCGDKTRARNLAAQCIAIDPTCFSR